MYDTDIVMSDKGQLAHWYEPQHKMLGTRYASYARGSTYVLSRKALRLIASVPPQGLRYFRSEGERMGAPPRVPGITWCPHRRDGGHVDGCVQPDIF